MPLDVVDETIGAGVVTANCISAAELRLYDLGQLLTQFNTNKMNIDDNSVSTAHAGVIILYSYRTHKLVQKQEQWNKPMPLNLGTHMGHQGLCKQACMYVCIYVRVCVRVCMCVRPCMYVCVCMCVCMCVYRVTHPH